MTSVNRIFASTFDGRCTKRSNEFMVGFRAALESKIENKKIIAPYPLGSIQADAFYSGLEAGYFLCDQELIKRPILNCEKTTLRGQRFRKCKIDNFPLDIRIALNHALDENDFCELGKRSEELRRAGYQVSESSLRNYAQRLCIDLARAGRLFEKLEGVGE
ncbi:DUF3486 family protein [Pseudomonas yamanorum]|nr:DUF3486 family protein [Pseudomonas yamanorum]